MLIAFSANVIESFFNILVAVSLFDEIKDEVFITITIIPVQVHPSGLLHDAPAVQQHPSILQLAQIQLHALFGGSFFLDGAPWFLVQLSSHCLTAVGPRNRKTVPYIILYVISFTAKALSYYLLFYYYKCK